MPPINPLYILIGTSLILVVLLLVDRYRHRNRNVTPSQAPAPVADHIAAVTTNLNNHVAALHQTVKNVGEILQSNVSKHIAEVHGNLANHLADLQQQVQALTEHVESTKAPDMHLHVSEMHVVAQDRRAPEAKVPGPVQPPRPANDKAVG